MKKTSITYQHIINTISNFFLIACVIVAAACVPSADSEPGIIHAKLGNHDLYIPEPYLKFRHTSVGEDSVLLQAWYPGSGIAPGDSSIDLAKEGIWWRQVRILMNYHHHPASVETLLDSQIQHLKAFEVVGIEHDLVHRRQPDGHIQDHRDVWVEEKDGRPDSFITCSERLIATDYPQCKHYILTSENIWLGVSYDRRFLPKWQLIKKNVEEMFESFQSPDTAKEFIGLRFSEMSHHEEGE